MRNLLILALTLSLFHISIAQDNVGIGTTNPNPNALLELDNNSNPLGLLLPRQDISTFTLTAAENGMMVFNTVDNKVYTWDGAILDWVSSTSEWGINGNDIYNLNSGNVGIGTMSPAFKLQVEGNATINGIAPGPGLNINGVDGSYAPSVALDNGVQDWRLTAWGTDFIIVKSSGATFTPFRIRNTSFSNALVVGTNGVSIGTTASANMLDVEGAMAIGSTYSGSTTAPTNGLLVEGNVGIGTTSELAKVNISGDLLADNGAFATSVIGGANISAATNVDHIWHNDGTNSWHMVSDDAYKATGNTTLYIGRLLINNDATSNCTTGGSPFFIESCNDISSELEFNFSGNFTGTQATAMPDLDILAVSDGFGIVGSFSNAGRFDFRQNNSNMFSISSGSVYPGTDNLASCGTSSSRWTTVYASNGTISTSDKRLKENIESLNYGLGTLMQMKPVTFDWKDKASGKKIGFIAQDLQEIIPEVVNIGDDENKTLGVYYSDLIPVLVKAIQEQQSEIETLKNQMREMEASIRN